MFKIWSFLLILLCGCSFTEEPEMVKIKGGEFIRGVKNGVENPVQKIEVDSFYISNKEVAIKEYLVYLKERGMDPNGFLEAYYRKFDLSKETKIPDDWPVFGIDFYEALGFCNWMSDRKGLERVYVVTTQNNRKKAIWDIKKNGFRLPTEAEWEYAASYGGKAINDEIEKNLGDYAWLKFNSKGIIHATGTKQPNGFGLYDMLGNVSEWCWDYYDEYYYKTSEIKNPIGPPIGNNPEPLYENEGGSTIDRVVRGASFESTSAHTYSRVGIHPELTELIIIGFRLVKNDYKKLYVQNVQSE